MDDTKTDAFHRASNACKNHYRCDNTKRKYHMRCTHGTHVVHVLVFLPPLPCLGGGGVLLSPLGR